MRFCVFLKIDVFVARREGNELNIESFIVDSLIIYRVSHDYSPMLILNYRQTVKDELVVFFAKGCSTFRILFEAKIKYFWPLVISQSQRA